MDARRRGADRSAARRVRAAPAAAGVLLAALLPAGCTAQWAVGSGESTETCVSWVVEPDDASRADVASIVLDGRVLDADGQRTMFGTRATVWQVEVVAVAKGELTVGDVVEVASTPQTCAGAAYPDGDPLAGVDGVARLYLHDSDFAIAGTEAGLALISPFDGVGDIAP